jgi:2-polyprenyl-3-methyl-5-hydroxy-6-metoxy-1,4-benzoquinol methylase
MYYQGKEILELDDGLELDSFYMLTNCPICRSKSHWLDSIPTINPISTQKFDLLKCSSCEHWWINPMPVQKYLNTLYQDCSPYTVEKVELNDDEISNILSIPEKSVLDYELKLNQELLAEINYLEIGIGDGRLFTAFQQRSANCSGVEPGNTAKKFKGVYHDILELPRNIKYDVIVANDVLEHLESPEDYLNFFSSVSHLKTRLYCSFPNNLSLRASFQKGKWRMVRPIGHLHYFSEQSLRLLFRSTGWKIIELQKTDLFDFNRIDMRKNPIENLARILIELFNVGDQWIVKAIPLEER